MLLFLSVLVLSGLARKQSSVHQYIDKSLAPSIVGLIIWQDLFILWCSFVVYLPTVENIYIYELYKTKKMKTSGASNTDELNKSSHSKVSKKSTKSRSKSAKLELTGKNSLSASASSSTASAVSGGVAVGSLPATPTHLNMVTTPTTPTSSLGNYNLFDASFAVAGSGGHGLAGGIAGAEASGNSSRMVRMPISGPSYGTSSLYCRVIRRAMLVSIRAASRSFGSSTTRPMWNSPRMCAPVWRKMPPTKSGS